MCNVDLANLMYLCIASVAPRRLENLSLGEGKALNAQ